MTGKRGLIATFAVLYFVQGTCEPTYGLLAQPLRAWLLRQGATPGECARTMALAGLPWLLKPLYGPLVDSLRRRGWLVFASALAMFGFAMLALRVPSAGWLGVSLLVPSLGIALGDVATDALMVEHGQRLRITGLLQSAQWTASYVGTLLVGVLGGWLAGDVRLAFTLAAGLCLFGLLGGVLGFQAGRTRPVGKFELRAAWSPPILHAALFLFLLGFSPFHGLDYAHFTRDLGLSDTHYGRSISLSALFSIAACLLYGWLSSRVELRKLGHASVAGSLASTLALLVVEGAWSHYAVSAFTAFTWTFTLLMQLDLAARLCPPRYAGTVFALLMGVSNGADSLASFLGGSLHDQLAPAWGASGAYALLVVLGALATVLAWWLALRLGTLNAAPPPDPSEGGAM
ncbi:MAG: MFS transporter [Polyangiales bacterium]